MRKLAIITTHPIQYYAPVFQLLNQRSLISVKVFYSAGKQKEKPYDHGFQHAVEWDIPLLQGYSYEWAINTAADPGSHHFKGIVTPSLQAQIDRWQPDALLVIGWAYQSHLKIIRHYRYRLPLYFRGDSTLIDEKSGGWQWLRKLTLRLIYSNIDHAFYNGYHNRAYFKKYGLTDAQLSFAPHAVDNDRFGQDRSSEAQWLRRELNICGKEIMVLFAGKFESKKSPDLLLSAFLRLNRRDIHLVFVGAGQLAKSLQNTALKCDRVHFLPFQNQSRMPVIYQSCDLFCLPSKGPAETWGLAVNEAMASGKAILVSDRVGCAPDLVSESNGKIFPYDDEEALVSALIYLADKPKLNEFGLFSRSIIQSWNFEHIATAIERQLLSDSFIK